MIKLIEAKDNHTIVVDVKDSTRKNRYKIELIKRIEIYDTNIIVYHCNNSDIIYFKKSNIDELTIFQVVS